MMSTENIIERKSFQLIEKAIMHEATDIHLVPYQKGYDVSFKKDSNLKDPEHFPPSWRAV